MRGRRVVAEKGVARVGLIPAGAGQTFSSSHQSASCGAHPRGCGADVDVVGFGESDLGSSPRVRGRRMGSRQRRNEGGLIPAGAGQTACLDNSTRSSRAHPRGCGADIRLCDGTYQDPGSSPRVRGRLGHHPFKVERRGLIPAGAGQTKQPTSCLSGCRAHPSGCGADGIGLNLLWGASGSSPRVRGRLAWADDAPHWLGLIPAGAGQTRPVQYRRPAHGAHPRGCGADAGANVLAVSRQGSSPRVRGRRPGGVDLVEQVGLIPAGAGQTPLCPAVAPRRGAHPRGCGADPLQPARLRRLKQLYSQLCGATVKVPRECGE